MMFGDPFNVFYNLLTPVDIVIYILCVVVFVLIIVYLGVINV